MTAPARRFIVLSLSAVLSFTAVSCSTKPDEPTEVFTRRRQADSLMTQGHDRTDVLDFASARTSYEAALGIYGSLDHREGVVEALLALGRNSRLDGNDEAAEEFYFHARSLAETAGDASGIQDSLNHQADLALRRGDPVKAIALLEGRVDAAGLDTGGVGGREHAARLRLLGSSRYELGDEEAAEILLRQSVDAAREAGEPSEEAQACYKLASIASLGARFDEALSWAAQALDADKSAEYAPGIAADLRALAIISAKSGDDAAAEDYYRRSWLAWRGLGRDMDAGESRAALEKLTGRSISVL